jgi:hypothetical protein
MPGIKLHHPELRNCTYTLIHEGRPLEHPTKCMVCRVTHRHKTYHLGLDKHGDVTVSEQVFERLKEAGLDELEPKGEIAKPPPQTVGLAESPLEQELVVISREHGRRR